MALPQNVCVNVKKVLRQTWGLRVKHKAYQGCSELYAVQSHVKFANVLAVTGPADLILWAFKV